MGVGYDSDEDTAVQCPLADDLKFVAKQELREDDIIRKHSLRAMRDWIRKHPDIVNCRTGTGPRDPFQKPLGRVRLFETTFRPKRV